jgi:flagellar basal-body rod modification protein FlgD
MTVAAVTATNTNSGATSSKSIGDLGKDDFLKLLLAQLQNQDPMKPMDDTQFMAQLVQFSSLESMQHMDDHISMLLSVEQLGQAKSLIGKEVTGITGTPAEVVSGVVDSVKMVDGSSVLMIGEKSLSLGDVTDVIDRQSSDIAQASNMIGMDVEAEVGTNGTSVRGIVDAVRVVDGEPILEIGSQDVKLSEIVKVREGTR